MTQVDEKGHEGNTAVVTARLVGGNMVTETAGQEFLLTSTIISFEHYISYLYNNPAEYYYLL